MEAMKVSSQIKIPSFSLLELAEGYGLRFEYMLQLDLSTVHSQTETCRTYQSESLYTITGSFKKHYLSLGLVKIILLTYILVFYTVILIHNMQHASPYHSRKH